MAGLEKLRPNDPETIGPYTIVARLGSGGMGVVFLGRKGAKRFAIKIVKDSFLDDPSLRSRFSREIETLRKIDSVYVARIEDFSTEGEFAWHATEFVNGPTLRELIDNEGPLNQEEWWSLARELKSALDAIHIEGIIHRDIKPSNIIISDSGAKIIDFGISLDSDATSITSTGLVSGSPAWLSPEQLEGKELSPGSDLFSAGSVLVFAATGRSPWGVETSMSVPVVYQKILTGDMDLGGLSAQQQDVVRNLQGTDPNKRRFALNLDSSGKAGKNSRHTSVEEEQKHRNELVDNSDRNDGKQLRKFKKQVPMVLVLGIGALIGAFALIPNFETDIEVDEEVANLDDVQNQNSSSECFLGAEIVEQTSRQFIQSSSGGLAEAKALNDQIDSVLGRDRTIPSTSPNVAARSLYELGIALSSAISRVEDGKLSPSTNAIQSHLGTTGMVRTAVENFKVACNGSEGQLTLGQETAPNDVSIKWVSRSPGIVVTVTVPGRSPDTRVEASFPTGWYEGEYPDGVFIDEPYGSDCVRQVAMVPKSPTSSAFEIGCSEGSEFLRAKSIFSEVNPGSNLGIAVYVGDSRRFGSIWLGGIAEGFPATLSLR